jgi:hypothetical protein
MFFNVSKTQKEEQEKSKIIILGVNIERARGTGGADMFLTGKEGYSIGNM